MPGWRPAGYCAAHSEPNYPTAAQALETTKLLTVRRRECHAVLHLAALHRHALELGLLLTFSPSLNLGTRELRTRKDLEVTARIQENTSCEVKLSLLLDRQLVEVNRW